MSNNDSHVKDLENEIRHLKEQVKDLKSAEKINQVSFEISSAVNTTDDLNELYKSIHASLKKILPLPNFFISIIDKERNWLTFPYYEDFHDTGDAYLPRPVEMPSLTKTVIESRKPLFLSKEELLAEDSKGAVRGSVSEVWIGAPLIISDEVIGVIAMYAYDSSDIFTEKNKNLFVSISNQVAMAIDRKHALEKLEHNEETFRALTENSDDITLRYDSEFRHLYASPAVRNLGFEPEEMIGKTCKETGVPAALSQKLEKEIKKVFLTGKSGRVQLHLLKDKWVDWLLYPEFSSEGDVTAVITSGRDITETKKLELQRWYLNKINQIVISSKDINSMMDKALQEVQNAFSSDRAWICQLNINTYEFHIEHEYTVPEWPGALEKNAPVIINQKGIDEILDLVSRKELSLFNKQSLSKLLQKADDDYDVKSMMLIPVHIEEDLIWLFGLHQCSGEREWTFEEQDFFKQVGQRLAAGLINLLLNRKLRDAKSYIDNIIDSMPSAIISVDTDLKITEINLRAELNAGVLASEIKGSSLDSVFPHLEQRLSDIVMAMKEERVIGKTKIKRKVDNVFCYENVTIYPLIEETVNGAVIRIDDVSEQVKLEEMMLQSEKMLSVGGLAAGMAHEINNPLAGMMQNAQVMENRLLRNLPANQAAAGEAGISMEALNRYLEKRKIPQILEHINNAGKNAAEIVRNMLSFSHERTGKMELNHFADLIDKTIELAQHDYSLREKYDFRDIDIIREYEKELPDIMCEANTIQQVILNIFRNGAEAMFEKFSRSDSGERPKFIVRLSEDNMMLRLEIEDNGPGMDEETARQIFNPFFTTKPPDKGTGLGLSVSYFIIVEHHKGEIKVESTPGQGSRFMIKLPV